MKTLLTAAAVSLVATTAFSQAIEINEAQAISVWMEPSLETLDDEGAAELWEIVGSRFVDIGDTWVLYQSDEADNLTSSEMNNSNWLPQNWWNANVFEYDNAKALEANHDAGFTGQNITIKVACGGNSVITQQATEDLAPSATVNCGIAHGHSELTKNGTTLKLGAKEFGTVADGYLGVRFGVEEDSKWLNAAYSNALVATTWNRFGNLSADQMEDLIVSTQAEDGTLDGIAMNTPLSNNY